MMIELIGFTGHPGNLNKTQIVAVRILKRKNDVYEIFSKMRDVGDPPTWRRDADHGFGRMYSHRPDTFEFLHEIKK